MVWQDAMRGERRGKGKALASARGRVRSRALQRGWAVLAAAVVGVFLVVWRRRWCWACDLDLRCFAKVAGLIFRAKKARAHDSTPSFSCSAGRSSGG